MIVLSDASLLVSLAEIGRLDVLRELYAKITITSAVYDEVVVVGQGLAGAAEVGAASWIEVGDSGEIIAPHSLERTLGRGELTTIALARRMKADLTIIDDFAARRAAEQEGLTVFRCVGVLESAYRRGFLNDLTETYRRLLGSAAYISKRILSESLIRLNQPPL